MNKQQAQSYIQDREAIITGLGDSLWQEPETAFGEFKSVEKICAVLEDNGFVIEKGVGDEAKAEHLKRLGGATYKCPIPAGVKPRAIDKL